MTTLQDFIAARKITMTAEYADRNPNMDGSENMDNWRCVLKHARRTMTVPFSMGVGHNGKEPKAEDVLDCIASDASSIENARDFDDWCSDYGYDTDSRKAERTYKLCKRQAESLRRFLASEEDYQDLLFNIDRL